MANEFDIAFYRSSNPDLHALVDRELHRHYKAHGAREGRPANREAFFKKLSANGSGIPSDFIPEVYRRLNPDVDAHCGTDWDAYTHYSEYGRDEGRSYSDLDWKFYLALYLGGKDLPRENVVEHYVSIGYEKKSYTSETALLAAFELTPDAFWLEAFAAREFTFLNSGWVAGVLNREQALALFLAEGVDRLAAMSFAKRFDPAFYREINPHLARQGDVQLYWRWLRGDASEANACSEASWLAARSFAMERFPGGFAWRRYAGERALEGRWKALAHLIDHVVSDATSVPVVEPDAAKFLCALGLKLVQSGRNDLAIEVFERAHAFGDVAVAPRHLAECYFAAGRWRCAVDSYDLARSHGATARVSDIVRTATALMRLHEHAEALQLLADASGAYSGSAEWRACLDATMEKYFAHVSDQARSIYSDGDRASADELLLDAVNAVAAQWETCLSLPVLARARPAGRVVMLAVTSLKQCKHYRVDQKKIFLDLYDIDVEIFDWTEVDAFLQALPDADAAIFYRLPAFPNVVRAILSARSQNIPTYYDIDDLIFDSNLYPDPYETFEGAISHRVYQDLMFGTPLHAAAIRLCDFGLASTPALAAHVSRFVRTGRTFVIRNALDERILAPLPKAQLDGPSSRVIHVFYGSATLAHNQDFNDVACHALLPLMIADQTIKLVIAGHLDLDARFDAVRNRVVRLGMIDDMSAYWSILSGCDINLATLGDTPMNNSKSEIKWLEAAALGVPTIASATQTYREVIEDGVTGLMASTLDEWAIAMKRLVADSGLRRRIGAAARSHVRATYRPEVIADALVQALDACGSRREGPRKKRALIVNVFFPPQSIGGATRVVADNVRCWLDGDAGGEWEFAVATTDYQNPVPYSEVTESWLGIPVFRVAPPFTHHLDWEAYDPRMKRWFERILARFAPDVVHFHCVQRLTGAVVEACLEAGIPYAVTAHDGWWLSDYQFMFDEACRVRSPGDEQRLGLRPGISAGQNIGRKLRLEPLLHGAAALLTPSLRFAEIYRQAGFAKATALANGLPNLEIRPRTISPSGRVRVGHIGDTSPHKGFDLIEAALRQNQFENIELVGVSHGQGEAVRVRDVWGASPVLLRDKVPQELVGELYAELDVLAAPSACVESYGLVTREANAAGLWVIASDRGAIGEDVRPGVDGFIIDVSTPAELVEVFRTINDDPARFLKSAPRHAVPSAAQQSAKLLALYAQVVETRGTVSTYAPVGASAARDRPTALRSA